MNTPKTIPQLIHPPRLDNPEPCEEVEVDFVELKAINKDLLLIEPVTYRYIDFSDCLLTNLSANNVVSFRSNTLRCVFKTCTLTGLQLPEGSFKDVVFEDCRLNLANFRNTTFERCIFRSCDLNEADFAAAKCVNVLFEDCQLIQTDFSNLSSTRLEFNGVSLSDIKGVGGLKGATLSQQNVAEIAPLLAGLLEMKVL